MNKSFASASVMPAYSAKCCSIPLGPLRLARKKASCGAGTPNWRHTHRTIVCMHALISTLDVPASKRWAIGRLIPATPLEVTSLPGKPPFAVAYASLTTATPPASLTSTGWRNTPLSDRSMLR